MLKQATNQNLEYLKSVLTQLTDQQFSRPLEVLSNSTLGMHVRHVLEFYKCLISATEASGVVDYDARVRDVSLELGTENCLDLISKISEFLTNMEGDTPMKLKANYSFNANEECESMTIDTTLYRELQFNIEHAVHHLAIIKIGIRALEDAFEIDANFGIAASTIRNKNTCAQ